MGGRCWVVGGGAAGATVGHGATGRRPTATSSTSTQRHRVPPTPTSSNTCRFRSRPRNAPSLPRGREGRGNGVLREGQLEEEIVRQDPQQRASDQNTNNNTCDSTTIQSTFWLFVHGRIIRGRYARAGGYASVRALNARTRLKRVPHLLTVYRTCIQRILCTSILRTDGSETE